MKKRPQDKFLCGRKVMKKLSDYLASYSCNCFCDINYVLLGEACCQPFVDFSYWFKLGNKLFDILIFHIRFANIEKQIKGLLLFNQNL